MRDYVMNTSKKILSINDGEYSIPVNPVSVLFKTDSHKTVNFKEKERYPASILNHAKLDLPSKNNLSPKSYWRK